MKKAENEIEKYLVDSIESVGGQCFKWVSPGNRGVPDRIVLMPGQKICFVETKRENGGRIRNLQKYRAKQIESYGFKTFFIKTKSQVDKLAECLNKGVIPDEV